MSVYEDLRDQIAESFGREAIERILSDTLNIDFSDLPAGGDYVQLLFELQRKGLQEGWYEDFLKELAKRRPGKAPFQAAIKAVLDEMHKPRRPQTLFDDPAPDPKPAPTPSAVAALRALAGSLANLRTIRQTALVVLAAGAAIWAVFGWVPIRTEVWLEGDTGQSAREGRNVDTGAASTLRKGSIGYSIRSGARRYGTNDQGETWLLLSPVQYAGNWLMDSSLTVEVADAGIFRKRPINVRDPKLELERTFASPGPVSPVSGGSGNPGASLDTPAGVHTAAAGPWTLMGKATAAPATGGRLYIQSISVPGGVSSGAVSATLTSEGKTFSLSELNSSSGGPGDAQLQVRTNSAVVQNYQLFFDLPRPGVAAKSVIRLQTQAWFGGYSDTFTLPDNLALGQPTALKSDRNSGATLVVQLAYPIDVVFFERLRTPGTTKKLVPLVGAAGFATRLNTRGIESGGPYNVVYAGEDVPPEALQRLLKAVLDGGVKLKYVQAGIKLSSGIQNQIQVGSNDAVACLDDLSPAQIKEMLGPPADLLSFVGKLPKPKAGDDCIKDD